MVDCIPMHEILCVVEMQESMLNDLPDAVETSFDERKGTDPAAQMFLMKKSVKGQVNTLQIKTIPEGYNRCSYYLNCCIAFA